MPDSNKSQLLPSLQGAKCSEAASRTRCQEVQQGSPRDSSQIQSGVSMIQEAHDHEADPGSSWKSIHKSESGLMIVPRVKYSLVNTRLAPAETAQDY